MLQRGVDPQPLSAAWKAADFTLTMHRTQFHARGRVHRSKLEADTCKTRRILQVKLFAEVLRFYRCDGHVVLVVLLFVGQGELGEVEGARGE